MLTRVPLLLCAFTLWCATAVAQSDVPAPTLTSRGRIMLAGQVSGFWSNDEPALFGSNRTWTVRADPALTYFVWDDLGFGTVLSGSYLRGEEFGGGELEERGLGIAAECVWNLSLGGGFSLMLRGSLGYQYARAVLAIPVDQPPDVFPVTGSWSELRHEQSRHYLGFSVSLPLVYALSDSVGLGGGPTLSYDHLVRGTRKSEGPGASGQEHMTGSRLQLGARVGVYASF